MGIANMVKSAELSASGLHVAAVRAAVAILRENRPELLADTNVQGRFFCPEK